MKEAPQITMMEHLKKMNLCKVALAIEQGAGRALPGLRKSLQQGKAGEVIVVRQQKQSLR